MLAAAEEHDRLAVVLGQLARRRARAAAAVPAARRGCCGAAARRTVRGAAQARQRAPRATAAAAASALFQPRQAAVHHVEPLEQLRHRRLQLADARIGRGGLRRR